MRRRVLIVVGVVVAVGLITYGVLTAVSSSIRLEFDFRDGAQGWEAGFAEYGLEMEDMQLEAGIRPLPSELGTEDTGYYLKGMNHSDDFFMFLKR